MFRLIKIENARMNVPEPEYLTATASEAITIGEALVLASGALTKCGATTKPTFIAMAGLSADATDRVIPVCRVEPNQIYEVETAADASAAVVGTKVTLHTDGLQVTATTTSGVAEIVSTNGAAAAGDKILVRFA